MNRMLGLILLLCVPVGVTGAQTAQTNRDIANNVRGETVNNRPDMNNSTPLNQLPTLDRTARIPEISLHSLISRSNVLPPASGTPRTPAVISIGEDQAPTQTQLEMIRRARENHIPLGDVAREARRQREASRTTAPNQKRWALEQQ